MSATIDVEQLRVFVTVVRDGSFTRAAETLGTQKSHLSRVLTRLEARLGTQLLRRTTRSLTVTETGRELFERATGILSALDETEAAMLHAQGRPTGMLRLTCGQEFGLLAVSRWIGSYLDRYPEVRVEADFTNRIVDIVHEGVDVAIRVGALEDSSLSARKLGEVAYAFYATPAYLRARGEPDVPAALARHNTVVFAPPGRPPVLRLVRGHESCSVQVAPRLVVNNNLAARDAVAAGLGIGLLPVFQAEPLVASGMLAGTLREWTRPPVPVHAVFVSSRYLAPKGT